MNLLRSFLGRRQFLVAFASSALGLAFGRVARVFDLFFKRGVARAADKAGTGERKPLRAIVIYYSGTGNTAKIAGAIHRGIKSVIPSCDISPIAPSLVAKVKPEDMSKYDLVAVGSPNWWHREVANVKIFTHDMPRMDGKQCVLFCTHGTQPTSQFWSMSRNMLKKGMTIIGWGDWYGPQTQLHGLPHRLHTATGHPDEIDLAEAEAFGRLMAEHSIRIYAGERDLIPRIPTPSIGEQNQWSPTGSASEHRITFTAPPSYIEPIFDLTKCVYPRCTQCVDNCPMHAIDLSVMTTANSTKIGESTASPVILKEGCLSCGGLCKRVCLYDVIEYEGEEFYYKLDMTKCTYPKCTVCIDWCTQPGAIDFSQDPPVIHNYCEHASLCFNVCPEDAISITNPIPRTQWWTRPQFRNTTSRTAMMEKAIEKAGGRTGPMMQREGGDGFEIMIGTWLPKFRNLMTEEEANKMILYDTLPRLTLKKEDWPCEMNE